MTRQEKIDIFIALLKGGNTYRQCLHEFKIAQVGLTKEDRKVFRDIAKSNGISVR